MKISNEQIVELYKRETNAKKKEKLLAVRHIKINKKSIQEVADILCKAYNTVKSWYKRFIEHGPDGLDDKPRSGRPPKLKNHKLDEFLAESDHVFPKILVARIKSEAHVSYTLSGIRKSLRERGYSPKVPMQSYANKAPIDEVIEWQKYMKGRISCLRRAGFRLWVADQTTIILDYVSKRGPWSPVGQRVYVPYHGTHQRIMVCGAFSTGVPPVFSITDQFKAPEALEFIQGLVRHRKSLLVVDRAKVHDSKIVREFVEQNPDKIQMEYFPRGWPTLNASEFAWNPLKSQPYIHGKYSNVDDRIDEVEEFANTYDFNLNVEQHLFKNPLAIT